MVTKFCTPKVHTFTFLVTITLLCCICDTAVSTGGLHQSQPGSTYKDGNKEYAFEMACSNIRYGEGVTREVGMDLINLGIKNTCVFTDKNVLFFFNIKNLSAMYLYISGQLVSLPPVKTALDSLHANGVSFSVYDNVSIEPTDAR